MSQHKSYIVSRMEHWGLEFAMGRSHGSLGFPRKNLLATVIELRGMPPRVTGFRPVEVDQQAQQIENAVMEIARQRMWTACVLRAYYCGDGRRKVERFEQCKALLKSTIGEEIRQRQYLETAAAGTEWVSRLITGVSL